MGDGHTDEPPATQRLTVAQAAARLGITEGAVRSRIKRGTLPTTKDGNAVFVLLVGGTSQTNHSTKDGETTDQPELVSELRDRVASLERQLERNADETERLHQIIGRLAQANTEQARTIRAIEAPTSQEPPEDAETIDEVPERSERQPAAAVPQDGAAPAPGTTEGDEATQQEESQAWEVLESDSGDRTLADSPEPSQAVSGPGSLEAEGDAQEPEPKEADSGMGESQQVMEQLDTRRRRRLPWWRRFLGQ